MSILRPNIDFDEREGAGEAVQYSDWDENELNEDKEIELINMNKQTSTLLMDKAKTLKDQLTIVLKTNGIDPLGVQK